MNRAISRAILVAFILFFCSILAGAPAYAVGYPFTENFEGAMDNWCLDAPWGTTTLYSHSPTHSLTDSPGGSYGASIDVSANLCSPVNLTSAQMPMLSFWNRYALEENADWGSLEVSVDGVNWAVLFAVTGQLATWKQERIDLSEYAETELYIRFRLVTNGAVNYDGWYIDDVRIEESAAAISYPFLDGMEGGTSNWLPAGWELSTPGQMGSYCWHADPYGYQDALTFAGTIDLTLAVNPQLSFWYKSDAWSASQYVQVSDSLGHGGTYQTTVAFGDTGGLWRQGQVDLSNYIGLPDVRIRFVNPWIGNWWIDDIRIEDTPPASAVVMYPPTSVTMHGADLSWKKYEIGIGPMFGGFARYEVYAAKTQYFDRSTAERKVCEIADVNQTSFADTYSVLQPDYYWYRLYIVDTTGMYSVPSDPVQAVYTIPSVSYPFYDDFEGGAGNWAWGFPWEQTTATSHSPSHCWTDSPGGGYASNQNTALTTFVNLRSARMPMLSFWNKHFLQEGADWGTVEVSVDGAQWATLFAVTGQQASWKQEKIDLSEYAGSDVFVRFRLQTDPAVNYDGWYIDDVRIEESAAIISYPFFDGAESGTANWLQAGWELSNPGQGGAYCWHSDPNGYQNALTLADTIDLSASVSPKLSFWYKSDAWYSSQYVQVSDYFGNGGTYQLSVPLGNTSGLWQQAQVDLSNYVGLPEVRVRFLNASTANVWIDDVSIAEGPAVEVTLVPDAPSVARGGTLGYTVTAINKTGSNRTFKYWTNVNLPNGAKYPPAGELFGPVTVTLAPFASRSVHLTHSIPVSAPLGVYKYSGYVGAYPTSVDDGVFYFEVVP